MKRGRFISFEGPEGGGKSTQARRLAEALEARGLRVVVTREPGGTPTGEAIREILQHDRAGEPLAPEAETLLFAACRAQLVRRIIRPALADGAWVICDRFADSTTVYQGHGRGFDPEAIRALHAFSLGDTWPDRTFLLDLDIEEGFRRIARARGGDGAGLDRMERETRAFHRRVREGYLALARAEPERICVLDAGADPGAVAARVWEEVARELDADG